MSLRCWIPSHMGGIALLALAALSRSLFAEMVVQADLLIVGGTESGCAAAVQAVRQGVTNICLVNDIAWLGGQFSAEALGAIDENRADDYNGTVPWPRNGLYREVYDRIRSLNAAKFNGVEAPGNARVNITALPCDSEQVFREILAPYEADGRIVRYSNYAPTAALTNAAGNTLEGVRFESVSGTGEVLTVHAPITIDASDWGDVIRLSGAAYEYGPDTQSAYGEPQAPTTAYPATDMNPITFGLIIEETATNQLIAMPTGYNARDFTVGTWTGVMTPARVYTDRRLVDAVAYGLNHPDVILINNPHIDYPLDVLPDSVVAALVHSIF